MLQVIFFGHELKLLEELQKYTKLLGVYVRIRNIHQRTLLEKLFNRFRVRRFFKPFIMRLPIIPPKLYQIYASYHLQDYLRKNHIRMFAFPSVNNPTLLRVISHLKPDLCIVAKFSEIIGRDLLNIPSYGFINFHPSLLPKYRGPHPYGHILLNHETISGVTWHLMTEKIDSGDILIQEEFPIKATDSHIELVKKSIDLGKRLLCSLLVSIEEGTCIPIPQNEAEASYYPKLTTEQKKLLRKICIERRDRKISLQPNKY